MVIKLVSGRRSDVEAPTPTGDALAQNAFDHDPNNDGFAQLVMQHGDQPMQPTYTDTTLPDGWCETRLSDGDMLSTLAERYLPALTKEEGARAIAAANGVRWATTEINAWVIDTGGRWLPQNEGDAPVPGSPTGGWAVFTGSSQINLPCQPVTSDDDGADCSCKKGGGFPWLAVAGAALVGGTATYYATKKKKRR